MRILPLLLLTICSCSTPGKETMSTNNPNFNVELLFEHDGCKVYRFSDAGRSRYFSNCQGSISWTDKHGKSTAEMEVITSLNDSVQ